MELQINAKREIYEEGILALYKTGIFVRAKDTTGKWKSVDLCFLEKDSLLKWLRSRGGENQFAENVVGVILGYGSLHAHHLNGE